MLDITKRVRKLPVPLRPWADPTKRIDLFQLELYLEHARRDAEADDFDLRPTTRMRAVVPVMPAAPRAPLPFALVVATAVASTMLAVFASGCGTETYGEEIVTPAGEDPEIATRSEYFCPDQHVTRRETARHVEKLEHGVAFAPPAAANMFHDVERSTVDAAWIEQMFRDGVTRGVSAAFFAPDIAVSRQEMAAFVARVLYGKDFQRAGASRYSDVTNSDFIGYIEQLADDGIIAGCTESRFCPEAKLPRGELATVLGRASARGAAAPQGSSRFVDAVGHPAESFIEKAVADGLVDACAKTLAPPSLREGEPGFEGVPVDRPQDTFVGWLPDTPDYGRYVVARDKRWWSDRQRDYCGGAYRATMTLDIGEVSYRGIYVRSVTFSTRSAQHVAQWSQIPLDGKFYPVASEGIDSAGLPYRSYRVDGWVGSELALAQVFMPHDQYAWSGELTDATDPAWCGMRVDYRLRRP